MSKLLESVKNSASFILVWVITFVALYVLAKLIENKLSHNEKKAVGIKRLSLIAMFSALAGVLMSIEFPLFFAPSFYKFDFSELPVLMISFYLGPSAGVTVAFLKVVIKILIRSTSTAFVGDFANFLTCCALILPASIIYLKSKSKKSAVIALVAGTLTLTIFGSFFNAFYLIPTFSKLFGLPLDVIVQMGTKVNPAITSVNTLVLFAVVPFNLLKGTVVSILTMLLYKRLEKIFFKK